MINLSVELNHKVDRKKNITSDGMTEHSIYTYFFNLLEEANIKVTLYTTLEAIQEKGLIEEIADNPIIEFGGKENDSFEVNWGRTWKMMEGSAHGFENFKSWKIAKTLEQLQSKIDRNPSIWREQNNTVDQDVEKILSDFGVSLISNGINTTNVRPYWNGKNLLYFPVNVHWSLMNERISNTKNRIETSYYESGYEQVAVDQCTDQIIETIILNQVESIPSSILLDPIELYKIDQFESLRLNLIDFLIEEETVHMSEIHHFELARLHYGNRNN